ncbi:MAG TPA: cyclic nucleotide-binding domain-containing protein [Gammaproteobacteria bacterium]|nr:cyclic nucleotide-binding domain-containing protein [Gammaproteobacteria bacterium]
MSELVPLHGLTLDHLQELARKFPVEELPPGTVIFAAGEQDARAIYLLTGAVVLEAPRQTKETVRAGTDTARYPLAHHQPRRLSARALGPVSVIRIDASLLDMMLEWRRTDSYEVTELDSVPENDDTDWLVRFLQSAGAGRIPAGNLHTLLGRLEEVPFARGATVVRAGDPADSYYIVKQGRCSVLRSAAPGASVESVAELGPGEGFGEEALVTGAARNATVRMVEDGMLLRLSREDFHELLAEPLLHHVSYGQARALLLKGAALVDVRNAAERRAVPLDGSLHLPLALLREQAAELEHDRPYILCCDTGIRAAAAALLLANRGFEVSILERGLRSIPGYEASVSGPAPRPHVVPRDVVGGRGPDGPAAALSVAPADAIEQARRAVDDEAVRMRQDATAARSKAEDQALRAAQGRERAERDAAESVQRAEHAQRRAEQEAQALRAEQVRMEQEAAAAAEQIRSDLEAARRKAAADAAHLKADADQARQNAREQAQRAAQADAARTEAQKEAARIRAEADAARAEAGDLAVRLQEHSRVSEQAAEDKERRLRAEWEAGRRAAEERAARLQSEGEAARRTAEEVAQRAAVVEQARVAAETELERIRQEMQTTKSQAEREIAALQQAQIQRAEQVRHEAARIHGEMERLRRDTDVELEQLRSEAEAARRAAQDEARRLEAADVARIAAQREVQQMREEAEVIRRQAEQETERLRAELTAVQQRAREEVEKSSAAALARARAEQQTDRVREEEGARREVAVGAARKQAAQEVLRVQAAEVARRRRAEAEVARLRAEVEAARSQATEEAERAAQAEAAHRRAAQEARRLAQADAARAQAEQEVRRVQAAAEAARHKAEQEARHLREAADALERRVAAEQVLREAAEQAERIRVAYEGFAPTDAESDPEPAPSPATRAGLAAPPLAASPPTSPVSEEFPPERAAAPPPRAAAGAAPQGLKRALPKDEPPPPLDFSMPWLQDLVDPDPEPAPRIDAASANITAEGEGGAEPEEFVVLPRIPEIPPWDAEVGPRDTSTASQVVIPPAASTLRARSSALPVAPSQGDVEDLPSPVSKPVRVAEEVPPRRAGSQPRTAVGRVMAVLGASLALVAGSAVYLHTVAQREDRAPLPALVTAPRHAPAVVAVTPVPAAASPVPAVPTSQAPSIEAAEHRVLAQAEQRLRMRQRAQGVATPAPTGPILRGGSLPAPVHGGPEPARVGPSAAGMATSATRVNRAPIGVPVADTRTSPTLSQGLPVPSSPAPSGVPKAASRAPVVRPPDPSGRLPAAVPPPSPGRDTRGSAPRAAVPVVTPDPAPPTITAPAAAAAIIPASQSGTGVTKSVTNSLIPTPTPTHQP